MREEDSNWFAKWEEELPSPEELIPLSQSLITPDLAIAFDLLRTPNDNPSQPLPPSSAEFAADSSTGDEPARTLKRPRLVWTPQLHKRFVDAVAHLGIKNAVPKTIMQLMSVDGLTRENVASHLQKYRLYLKRMQSGCGGGGGESDHLFASSHVPSHFLHPAAARQGSDHFVPSFVPITASLQPPPPHPFLHRQISAVGFNSQGNINGKGMDQDQDQDQSLFLARQRQHQQQQQVMTRPASLHLHSQVAANYSEDLESGAKTVLTLFPSRED